MSDSPEGSLKSTAERHHCAPDRLSPLLVVAGPTAVGKTRLAIELALTFGGEVVNADSRYLYRGFSIGVAKPLLADQRGVPHHLIDILDAADEMSLALFQQRANEAIGSIHRKGALPILTGGTPLYLNAVIEGWTIPEVPPDPAFRRRMERLAETEGVGTLAAQLASVDPIAAERAGVNPRRIIRALEIFEATGRPMSAMEGKFPPPWRVLQLGLTMPREQLFAAIDARVDDQMARGLVDEVRTLLDAGVSPGCPAFSSIGYRQLLPYISGETDLPTAVERIKFDTHRYVRHQETWLRRNANLIRINVTEPDWIDTAKSHVESFLAAGNPKP